VPNLFVTFLRKGLALLSLESTCTKTKRASSTAKSCEEVRLSDPMPTSSANSTTAASRVAPREARQHENTPSRSSIPEENSRWRVAIPGTTTAWVADTCVEAPALYPLGLGPPQHHMGHGHGHGMGGGHMRGGTGTVPFRAGDWKCGENGCGTTRPPRRLDQADGRSRRRSRFLVRAKQGSAHERPPPRHYPVRTRELVHSIRRTSNCVLDLQAVSRLPLMGLAHRQHAMQLL